MTNRDEIKQSVDNMVAGWFNGEVHDVDKDDIIELVMKHSALSAAEPVGYTDASELSNDTGHGLFAYAQSDTSWLVGNPIALYTAAPALSAQVQDVAGVSPVDYMRRHDAAIAAYEANTPNDYRYSALALRKAVDAAFAAAAPAKQDKPD